MREGYVSTQPLYIDFDMGDMKGSLKKLDAMSNAIRIGTEIGVNRMKELLIERMKSELIKYGLGDSSLMTDIIVVPYPNGFLISVGQEYAVYVEYGTGIVGKENKQHPTAGEDGWIYDVKNHKYKGWIYKGSDSKTHWTAGQPSRPFMYNTWVYGNKYSRRIVDFYINRELKKVAGGRV